MARITLIWPPNVLGKLPIADLLVPPLGTAYIAAALREAGHAVQVIDSVAEAWNHVAPTGHPLLDYRGLRTEEIIERIDPAAQGIGVSSMFSVQWPHLRHILAGVRERFPHVPIILGGEHATAMHDFILETCPAVTCVGLGEGEETICDFAEYVEGKRPLESISSLAWRRGERGVRNPPRPRIRDIDSLPWPAWDLIPLGIYHEAGFRHGYGSHNLSMPLLGTRGCPYQCTFCSSPSMWTTRYVTRKPSLLLDEIESYMKEYGVADFDFYDLTAMTKREWIIDFCREIKRRGLKFNWQLPSGTRSEALDKNVLGQMYETGCRFLCYAPESGDADILSAVKKRVNLEGMESSIREAIKLGIRTRINIIIGFPRQTRRSIYKTLRFVLKMAWRGVDDAGIHPLSLYPGSEIYDALRKEGRIPETNDDYFASLATLSFGAANNHFGTVGPKEFNFYCIFLIGCFYSVSYLAHPRRILRTLRNLMTDRCETALERRIWGAMQRPRAAPINGRPDEIAA